MQIFEREKLEEWKRTLADPKQETYKSNNGKEN